MNRRFQAKLADCGWTALYGLQVDRLLPITDEMLSGSGSVSLGTHTTRDHEPWILPVKTGRVHGQCVSSTHDNGTCTRPCLRPVYTAMYTAVTGPVHGPTAVFRALVHSLRAVYTACAGLVHGCERAVYTGGLRPVYVFGMCVYARVYGPCTRRCAGPVHGRLRAEYGPCTPMAIKFSTMTHINPVKPTHDGKSIFTTKMADGRCPNISAVDIYSKRLSNVQNRWYNADGGGISAQPGEYD